MHYSRLKACTSNNHTLLDCVNVIEPNGSNSDNKKNQFNVFAMLKLSIPPFIAASFTIIVNGESARWDSVCHSNAQLRFWGLG